MEKDPTHSTTNVNITINESRNAEIELKVVAEASSVWNSVHAEVATDTTSISKSSFDNNKALRCFTVSHTLHTQDVLGVPGRLIDLGLSSVLLAGSLQAVIAQRLVRRLCQTCFGDTRRHVNCV